MRIPTEPLAFDVDKGLLKRARYDAGTVNLDRRALLRGGALVSGGLALSGCVPGLSSLTGHFDDGQWDTTEHVLSVFNKNTGESASLIYRVGQYHVPEALERLNYLLRDHHTNTMTRMDPKLFDLLYEVQEGMESDGPVHILSAYRSPETNARLRRRNRRAAKNSLHMWGKAVDARLPGVPTGTVTGLAKSLGKGGVGRYPRSGFVHLDTGPVRSWG